MFCWNGQQSSISQLPRQISKISKISSNNNEQIDDYFEPCEQHGKEIAFICKSLECRDKNNSMVCNQCLVDHKDHDWITKEDFLTANIRNILCFRKAEADKILESTLKKLQDHFNQIQSNIVDQFQRVRFQFQRSMLNIQEKYRFKIDRTIGTSHVILNKMKLQKLLSIYEIEQSKFQWIKVMQQNIIKITNQINQSFKNLLHDLLNISDAEKWQLRQSHIDEFKQFEKHLHWHTNDDDRYHKFSTYDKHMNIRLNNQNDEVTYVRSVPSKPVAVGSQYITHVHNKFGFQIMKMKSKAIFFDSTVIFVGICNINTVKSYGFRKVNEYGKGTYMISSQGWAYHSTDQNYNDKQIVGWGFGQGDKIQIQITFNADCTIKFTKKGRLFTNTFEMPLQLNEFQMNRLKPCVGFDSEQGAIVKIFDIKTEPLQIDL